jgi:N-acetylglutamate synthase-like GNAT family acetyltransferase
MIRACTYEDMKEIKRLHETYFAEEEFPEFMSYITSVVVEDEQGIILAGGVREIAECIAVTDQSRSVLDRSRALYQLLDAAKFVCRESGHDQMYAWSRNPRYSKRLVRTGFRFHEGQSLIYDL